MRQIKEIRCEWLSASVWADVTAERNFKTEVGSWVVILSCTTNLSICSCLFCSFSLNPVASSIPFRETFLMNQVFFPHKCWPVWASVALKYLKISVHVSKIFVKFTFQIPCIINKFLQFEPTNTLNFIKNYNTPAATCFEPYCCIIREHPIVQYSACNSRLEKWRLV